MKSVHLQINTNVNIYSMKHWFILSLVAFACLCILSCANKRTEASSASMEAEVENSEMLSEQDTPEMVAEFIQKMYADIFAKYSTRESGLNEAFDKYTSTDLKQLENDVRQAIVDEEIEPMCYGWDWDPWVLAQEWSRPAAEVVKVYDLHDSHCKADVAVKYDIEDSESKQVSLTLVKENGQWKVDDFAMAYNTGDKSYKNSLRKDFESAKADIGMDMIYIECDSGSFSLCKYEVTQSLWKRVMGDNPSQMQGDDLPVEQVSWDDCQAFISKFNELTGRNYRLPTEAEWEFACRGGKLSKGYKYSGSNNLDEVAWYDENSNGKTHPVGQKKPNELGLYDMSGNVWEWCQDMHEGTGMCRGGSWIHNARNCDPSLPNETPRTFSINSLGFRLAL